MKATITNISRDGNGFRVFAVFENGRDESFGFLADASEDEVRAVIRERGRFFDMLLEKAEALQCLVGQEIE